MNTQLQAAAAEYAVALIEGQYRRYRANERDAARLEALLRDEPATVAEFERKWHVDALELATAIASKSTLFLTKARQGMLHPSNSHSRRLFERVTGISLGKRVGDVAIALEAYCGAELRAFDGARQAEKDAKDEEKRRALEAAEEARFWLIGDKLLAGDEVTGDELVDACKSLQIPVSPSVVRMLREKFVSITADRARYRSRSKIKSQAAYELYAQARAALASRRSIAG